MIEMSIPICKPIISDKEINLVKEVLESGMLAQGKKVEEFEKNFSKYTGTKYGIATSNGTTSLHTALLAAGIKKGDEVITTPFSFIASSNSILYCGGKPIFSDIDNKTFNLDPQKLKKKITDKTKAILLVHLYGQPCGMDELIEISDENNLILIEDACQAHGAEYKGKKCGSFGKVSCFSFYATKNMTTGEGGMILTNSEEISEKCKLLRDHGQTSRYYHDVLGYNFRMTDFQAAIGIEQLKKLDNWNKIRIENAKFLTENLENLNEIKTPYVSPKVKHVFHQYTIRTEKISNKNFSDELTKKGIGNKIYYPVPIHKQNLYLNLGYKENLPEAELASKQVLSLPVHPLVSKDDLNLIVNSIKEVIE